MCKEKPQREKEIAQAINDQKLNFEQIEHKLMTIIKNHHRHGHIHHQEELLQNCYHQDHLLE